MNWPMITIGHDQKKAGPACPIPRWTPALGAEAARVQRSVLWSAARLLLLGLTIGLATSAALARLLEGLLFQVQPHDLTVYAAASGVLLAVGLAAAYLPARRASRVDPLIALRAE